MTLHVEQLLDEGRWTRYLKLLVFVTALTIVFAGFDNQLLAYAIPLMMKEWSVTRGEFSIVLFFGPIGMMFGGFLGGLLGDRIGRRSALLSSLLAFSLMTLAISMVDGISMLPILRFLSALGFGAAMPNAATLAYEYVPKRKRAFAVTLAIVSIPLGGIAAGYVSRTVLVVYGWRALFLLGGVIPIVLAFILFKELPESPRYLASYPARWPELITLLRRLGHDIPEDISITEIAAASKEHSRASIRDLFAPAFLRDSLGLFSAFFCCMLANYIGIYLLVVMLSSVGFSQPAASEAQQNFNLGGIGGALLGAFLIPRLGSRIALLGMTSASIVCALIVTTMKIDVGNPVGLMIMMILLGGFVNAVQTAMYLLAANVYPTAIRATGIGTAVAVGRIGNVLAGYAGNFALDKGWAGYFGSIVIVMIFTFGSLALIRRHIEPERGTSDPTAM